MIFVFLRLHFYPLSHKEGYVKLTSEQRLNLGSSIVLIWLVISCVLLQLIVLLVAAQDRVLESVGVDDPDHVIGIMIIRRLIRQMERSDESL